MSNMVHGIHTFAPEISLVYKVRGCGNIFAWVKNTFEHNRLLEEEDHKSYKIFPYTEYKIIF
jgi:hypothetical protein